MLYLNSLSLYNIKPKYIKILKQSYWCNFSLKCKENMIKTFMPQEKLKILDVCVTSIFSLQREAYSGQCARKHSCILNFPLKDTSFNSSWYKEKMMHLLWFGNGDKNIFHVVCWEGRAMAKPLGNGD